MSKKATGFFRGSGGGVQEMDLPLKVLYGDQLARGELVRVEAEPEERGDGTVHFVETGPWTGGLTEVEGGATIAPDARDTEIARLREQLATLQGGPAANEAVGVRRPAGNASKAAWVEYAVSQGMAPEEADAYTRDDLAAFYADK